jgi:hypothetical protein
MKAHRALFKYGRDNLHQNYVLCRVTFELKCTKHTDLYLIVTIFLHKKCSSIIFNGDNILHQN